MPVEGRWECVPSFEVKSGVRQGCVLSPTFQMFHGQGVQGSNGQVGGRPAHDYTIGGGLFLTYRDQTAFTTCLQDVLYVDDLALAETRRELQYMLKVLDEACT